MSLLAALATIGSAAPPAARLTACPPPPATLAFAPPLDRPLRLEVRTERPIKTGGVAQFQTIYGLQFTREDRGYRLTVTLMKIGSSPHGQAGGAMAAILAPMLNRPVEYSVGTDGATLIMRDGDKFWQAVADDIRRHAQQSPVPEGRAMGQLLHALPPAQREAALSADIRQMLRFAGRDWTGSYDRAPETDVPPCTFARFVSQPYKDGSGPAFSVQHRWDVELATGLVRQHREQHWLREGAAPAHESGTIWRSLSVE
jgi:hypothetical protein